MHALRRRICQALTILVFTDGAYILCRSLAALSLRLQHHAPTFPGCPDTYCDFSVFWLAGRLATTQGAASVYQSAHFFAAAARMLPHEIYGMPFMYPPPMLPLIVLISRPPLALGYYAFMAASLTAAILLLRRARLPWACIAAGLLGPAGLWCVYLGQFGILCSALLITGLALVESRPAQGGALLALLCIKPQYALLAPIILLARGNFRALAGAAITFAALLALALWSFGWTAWAAFLGAGSETIRALLQEPFMVSPARAGISVFWMARSIGASVAAAYALQCAAAALAAAFTWQLWRREAVAANTRIAITICLALLATPYGYTDDMVGYSIACALLMRRDAPVTTLLLALLWLAPAYIGHFAVTFGFLPTPLCSIAVTLIGWQRLRVATLPASPAPTGRQGGPVLFGTQSPSHRFR
jgi:hypothetical protein